MVQKFPKRDECRILYRITLKENLDSILDKGLIPDIGSQCTHCKNDNPTEKLVYMTDLEGIAKWKKALYGNSNSCVILEVNTLNLEIIYRRKFVEGTEYACKETILPDRLKIITLKWKILFNMLFIVIERDYVGTLNQQSVKVHL